MNGIRYFSLAFEQNDKIALSQNSYVRGEGEEGLVSFEKGKDFNTAKRRNKIGFRRVIGREKSKANYIKKGGGFR